MTRTAWKREDADAGAASIVKLRILGENLLDAARGPVDVTESDLEWAPTLSPPEVNPPLPE